MDNPSGDRSARQAGDVHVLPVLPVIPVLTVVAALLAGPAPTRADADPVITASQVRHDWDSRREAAWAASDPRRLRGLYVPGCSAAGADVRLLRSYARRGLVVRRIVTQVFALRVLHLDARSLRVWVVDRVAGGLVDGRALRTTRPRARVLAFRRVGGDWRVVSVTVRAPPRGPP